MSETQGACLPAGWRLCPLGDIATRVIRRNHIDSDNILTISARHGLVNQEDYFQRKVASSDRLGYWLLHRGDFAYNKSYSDGYPAGVVRRLENYDFGVVSPLYICFRPDERHVDPSFLAHYFDSGLLDDALLWVAKEGVRNHGLLNVRVDDFFNLPLLLPTLEEQRRIAEILDAVDYRLNVNSRIVAKLRSIRQGYIAENTDGRGADYPSVELGSLISRIDAGWSPLCEERTPPDGSWGVLKVSAVTSGIYRPEESKTLSHGLSPRPELEVKEGDLLVCRANGVRRLVGATVLVNKTPAKLMLSDKILRFVVRQKVIQGAYLNLCFSSNFVRRQIESMINGSSGQNNISQDSLRFIQIPLPDMKDQGLICQGLEELDRESSALLLERSKLQELKVGLAEDLLTGRVRVPEAEAVVESL